MLDIDLNKKKAETRDITNLFISHIGGTGVANEILAETNPETDPFASEAPIIFAIGPFTSIFPVATKTVAMFISPLTGDIGESHAGGRLGMAMHSADISLIRIKGKADNLSCLEIEDHKIKIHCASSLKQMSATATERMINDHFNTRHKKSILRIGPAGERLSPIACATVDSSRHFGRHGLGAVLGSKNIKAIIISGNNSSNIVDKSAFSSYYQKLYDSVVNSEQMKKYHDLGTTVNVIPLSKINGMPVRNFSQGFFEAADQISGEAFAEKHLSQQISCAHCQCGCIHMGTVRELFNKEINMYKTFKVSYDHELVFALGSNLSITDTNEILRLISYVEKQGWDAISIGVTLSWASEAFQKGIIDTELTDGLKLNFGDSKTYLIVLERIAQQHNEFFANLEKGAHYCSSKYGGKDFSITFGKLEAPGYMTGLHAYLGYATGIRHSHLDSAGYSFDQQKINSELSDEQYTEKLYEESVFRCLLNSLVICLFARKIYDTKTIIEGLNIMGLKISSEDDLMTKARTIHAAKYKLKRSLGFKFEDLYLPARLQNAITTTGKITTEMFNQQVAVYKKMIENDIKRYCS